MTAGSIILVVIIAIAILSVLAPLGALLYARRHGRSPSWLSAAGRVFRTLNALAFVGGFLTLLGMVIYLMATSK
jgi:hypothetical protein